MENVYFLTSNKKKAQDFLDFGLGVQEFTTEIPEVLSPNVETVVLYKAKETGLNNIVVEDTSLSVEGTDFWGTQIKHVYDEIKENSSFNNKKTVWEVSLCMKKDEFYYIATGSVEGKLKYPALDFGYHFDRIFAVPNNINSTDKEYVQFELLSPEQKVEIGPRFQALRKLVHAINTNDFSELKVIHEKDIKEWSGDYQIESTPKNKKRI